MIILPPKSFRFWFPCLWGVLFIVLPALFVLKVSLSESTFSIPPFADLWHQGAWRGTFSNYKAIFSDFFYLRVLFSSFTMAVMATFLTLLVAYPMAYALTRLSLTGRWLGIFLILLPFWTSFLIRIYAWISLLSTKGPLNAVLSFLGLPCVDLLDSSFAVCLGLVYCYLPFAVLPLYTVLEKQDPALKEAAMDLGASPLRTFWTVTFPLSKAGLFSAATLVFLPQLGEFVIPELLGGGESLMIGRIVWWEFFNHQDWPLACALAVILVFVFIVPLLWIQGRFTSGSLRK